MAVFKQMPLSARRTSEAQLHNTGNGVTKDAQRKTQSAIWRPQLGERGQNGILHARASEARITHLTVQGGTQGLNPSI